MGQTQPNKQPTFIDQRLGPRWDREAIDIGLNDCAWSLGALLHHFIHFDEIHTRVVNVQVSHIWNGECARQ